MNSVLPPPTSSNSQGWFAKSGSEVTPWKTHSASWSPEMISTFRPEAVSMRRKQFLGIERVARGAGGDHADGQRRCTRAPPAANVATAAAVAAIGPGCK